MGLGNLHNYVGRTACISSRYGIQLVVTGVFFQGPVINNTTQKCPTTSCPVVSPVVKSCRPARHDYKEPYTISRIFYDHHVHTSGFSETCSIVSIQGTLPIPKRTNKANQPYIIDRISYDRLTPTCMEPASFDTYTRSGRKCSVHQRMDVWLHLRGVVVVVQTFSYFPAPLFAIK